MNDSAPDSEFGKHLDELLRTGKIPNPEQLSEDSRQRLETASRLAQADYSGESLIRESLGARLARELPRRAGRARLSQKLSGAARLAGGAVLLLGLVLGLNLILGHIKPGTGAPVVTVSSKPPTVTYIPNTPTPLQPSSTPSTLSPTPAPAGTSAMASLEYTSWVLTALNGVKPIQGTQITLIFSADQAGGSAGCNNYAGKYPPQPNQAIDARYTVTARTCSPQVMHQEKAYLQAFWGSTDSLVENDLLIIKDPQGSPLMAFRRNSPSPHPKTDLIAAEGMLRQWYQNNRKDLNPGPPIPLKELTTDEIWERMSLQVFQVAQGPFQYDTFLIWQTAVLPMGTGFGGMGVTSMAVADLNSDGQPELLFTYSFGSGVHQSRLGMYAPSLPGDALIGSPGEVNGIVEADTTLRNGDLLLEKSDDQNVLLNAEMAGQPIQPIGEVRMLRQGQRVKLGMLIKPDLAAEVLNNLVVNPASGAAPQPTPNTAVDWATYENALAQVIQPGIESYCEWDILESTAQADYDWVGCAAKSSYQGTASSLPAVVYFDEQGHIQKVAIPGDGTQYGVDIKVLFPTDLQDILFNYNPDPDFFVHIQQRRIDPTLPPLVYLAGGLTRPLNSGLIP